MIKKDIKFIEDYEKREGSISFLKNQCCVSDTKNNTQLTHTFEDDFGEECFEFSIEDFYKTYKKIHGAKHRFTVHKKGIDVYLKKEDSYLTSHAIKSKKSSNILFLFNNLPQLQIGCIQSKDLQGFSILEKMTTNLEYIKCFQNPSLICEKNKLYFWGTDCIHQLRIDVQTATSLTLAYQLSRDDTKQISKFATRLNEDVKICYTKIMNKPSYISFVGEKDILRCSLIENDDIYTCEYKKGNEYIVSEKELEDLKGLGLKKLISDEKKKVKESFEVYIEVIEGIVYLRDKKIYELSEKITLSKRIEAYRFHELLKNATEIRINPKYILFNSIALVL